MKAYTSSKHAPKIDACSFLALVGSVILVATVPASGVELDGSTSSAVELTRGEYLQMIEDSTKAYQSPLNIPGAEFRNSGPNPEEFNIRTPFGSIVGGNLVNTFAVAPVYLPDGANLSWVGVQVYDGFDGTTGACGDVTMRDVTVQLIRVDNFTSDLDQMSYLTTSGMNGDRQYLMDTSPDFNIVDSPQYSYYAVAKVCHSSHEFFAMQVFYTMP